MLPCALREVRVPTLTPSQTRHRCTYGRRQGREAGERGENGSVVSPQERWGGVRVSCISVGGGGGELVKLRGSILKVRERIVSLSQTVQYRAVQSHRG